MKSGLIAVTEHQKAINEQHLEKYLQTTVFPFTYQNFTGISVRVESADDYHNSIYPWKLIKDAEQSWITTNLDNVQLLARSELSEAYKILGTWTGENGRELRSFQAIWIAVQKNDIWGIQFRHNLGTILPIETALPFYQD